MDHDQLAAALRLAARGFRVFPLEPGSKLPAIEDWPHRATSDPDKVRTLWTCPVMGWTQDFNIGVATGKGLVVLDVDTKKVDGNASLLDLQLEYNGTVTNTLEVGTPSGGRHLYFMCPDEVRNSVNALGPGLDVRGKGGYVVGPGSRIGDRDYVVTKEAKPLPLPDWLGTAIRKTAADPAPDMPPAGGLSDMDRPGDVARAVEYLQERAPLAVEGAGGDNTTYQVACRVIDFGVSEGLAVELLLEHWNERCSPPWLPDELLRKVGHAARYRQNPPGNMSPAADFQPVAEPEAAPNDYLAPRGVTPFRPLDLPSRPWIVDKWLLRRCVTVAVAPPGIGKSTMAINLAIAVAAGRGDMIGPEVRERARVWYWNNEDDELELQRRLAVAMAFHQVEWPDLTDNGTPRLYFNSGTEKPLTLAKRASDGHTLRAVNVDAIIRHAKASNIGLLIFDPMVEFHEAQENDNNEINRVARLFRRIATEANCAVLVVHHTRKLQGTSSEGHAGNMDSGRGAGALNGVARAVITLYGMSQADSKQHGVADHDRWKYVRVDLAKGNMSAGDGCYWFEKKGIPLGFTAGDEAGGAGEQVGVLAPVVFLSRDQAVNGPDVHAIWPGVAKRVAISELSGLLWEHSPGYKRITRQTIATGVRRWLDSKPVVEGFAYSVEASDNGRVQYFAVRRKV